MGAHVRHRRTDARARALSGTKMEIIIMRIVTPGRRVLTGRWERGGGCIFIPVRALTPGITFLLFAYLFAKRC